MSTPCRLGFASLSLALLLSAGPGQAFEIFPLGPGQALKWGGDNTVGTPGGEISWSIIPAGTSGSAFCSDACTGTSTGSIPVFDPGTGSFVPTALSDLLPIFQRAFDEWSSGGDISFTGPAADSGLPINDGGAVPPASGHIRIGAFDFTGSASFTGAVGFAPPPNGGTGEGDILFNSASFFQIASGNEGDSFDLFPPGGGPFMNEIENLFLHELGHALGLAHPLDPADDACMVMSIDPNCFDKINHALDADDIAGIQFLYGAAAVPEPGAWLLLASAGVAGLLRRGSLRSRRARGANVPVLGEPSGR